MLTQELILIVEDDDNSRLLLRDALAATGYRTLEATSGEDALTLAGAHHPALIVMDIQLPGINGVQVLHLLRADPALKRVPVIAVTASVMAAQQAQVMEAGFDAFEAKPLSVLAFLDTIRKTLDVRRGPGSRAT